MPIRLSLRLLPLLPLVGCEDVADRLIPEGGCVVDDGAFGSVSVGVADTDAVLRVAWTTDRPAVGQVLYETSERTWRTRPEDEASTAHEALLTGIPGPAEVSLRLVSDPSGDAVCSAVRTGTTGAPPAELPLFTVESGSVRPGSDVVVPVSEPGSSIVTMADGEGRYTWWWAADHYVFWATPTRDGEALLVVDEVPRMGGGVIRRVGLDGAVQAEFPFPTVHNQVVDLPDGTYAALTRETYTLESDGDARTAWSDQVLLVDPDGVSRTLWSAREALWDRAESWLLGSAMWKSGDEVHWTHATSLSVDEDGGLLLLALTNLNAVVAVDLVSGETAWILGMWVTDFPPPTGGLESLTQRPHSVLSLPDGSFLVYNQSTWRDGVPCGEPAVIRVDPDVPGAEMTWWVRTDDCTAPATMGSAWKDDDGRIVSCTGSSGRIEWFDEDGALTWRLSVAAGADLGGAIPLSFDG